jgi:hypothetical protein
MFRNRYPIYFYNFVASLRIIQQLISSKYKITNYIKKWLTKRLKNQKNMPYLVMVVNQKAQR